ncbi:hypothetical protein ASPZODRAFT_70199 [Penicilliopsis zonata CBS 506.65]|uniref:Major facilitator superfamily (MFS) profile domain-containing protein n=1 Tax=Penicilliopsis zonata CBS 506.65 TaxID=1073090 RepID=A0A1L9SD83_9EURO|nr:hypothetical protein ASPZODRAFT_70199 [Penicilliopsis zonata CBS 506.65]OJJ45141.1 hypothetical protein ASPZODRAFT_70199 [Penicilliopsis zonata CBS 506.65]
MTAKVQPACQPVQRGVLSFLTLIPAIEDPEKYPARQKWMLTTIIALGGLMTPLSSGILFPVLIDIADSFHTTESVVNLSIAFSSLAVAITPLWWSYLAESHGRRLVYLVSFLLLGVFNVLAAVSVNIGMFIAMRLLAGAAGASLQSVSAGTIADLFKAEERGKAMGLSMLGIMLGPMIAPIIGGALVTRWTWKSTQWLLTVYGFALFLVMLLCMPETATRMDEVRRCRAEERASQGPVMQRLGVVLKPLDALTLLRFPGVFITVLYTGVVFGTYYMLYISLEDVFSQPPYAWSAVLVGVAYVPGGLGLIVAAVLGGRWTDSIMKRAAVKAGRYDDEGNLVVHPEDRIGENVLVAAILYPGALLWWGWTVQYHEFWLVPLVANFVYGFAGMIVTNVTMTMLTEFVPRRSTMGVAVNNLVRNSLSCVAAVIAQPMISNMGNGWTFTAVCVFCILCGLPLILLRMKREEWHARMAAVVN